MFFIVEDELVGLACYLEAPNFAIVVFENDLKNLQKVFEQYEGRRSFST